MRTIRLSGKMKKFEGMRFRSERERREKIYLHACVFKDRRLHKRSIE